MSNDPNDRIAVKHIPRYHNRFRDEDPQSLVGESRQDAIKLANTLEEAIKAAGGQLNYPDADGTPCHCKVVNRDFRRLGGGGDNDPAKELRRKPIAEDFGTRRSVPSFPSTHRGGERRPVQSDLDT